MSASIQRTKASPEMRHYTHQERRADGESHRNRDEQRQRDRVASG
jgi:hypothetical protein